MNFRGPGDHREEVEIELLDRRVRILELSRGRHDDARLRGRRRLFQFT